MNRPLVFQQKPRILRGYYFYWSRCADSNRGPAHYECAARQEEDKGTVPMAA